MGEPTSWQREARQLRAQGKTPDEIAALVGQTVSAVCEALRGTRRPPAADREATVIRANLVRRCVGLGLSDGATGATLTGSRAMVQGYIMLRAPSRPSSLRVRSQVGTAVRQRSPDTATSRCPSLRLPQDPRKAGRCHQRTTYQKLRRAEAVGWQQHKDSGRHLDP
jgi:predicted transcriptional regulator